MSTFIESGPKRKVQILENSSEDGSLSFEAVVSEADYINRNRRLYPQNVLFPAFERYNSRIVDGSSSDDVGQVDHPDTGGFLYSGPSVSDLGIVWEGFRFEGNLVIGTGKVIPTAKGKDLQAVMRSGVKIGFSTRGSGTSEEETVDGKTIEILKEFELGSVDAVVNPSVRHARIRSTKESLDLEQELEDAIKQNGVTESKLSEATARVAILEKQVTDLTSERDSALERANTAEAALKTFEDAQAKTALESKLNDLTKEHRFGAAIRQEIDKMINLGVPVNLESVEPLIASVKTLVEAAASKYNENPDDGRQSPRGDLSTSENETPEPKVESTESVTGSTAIDEYARAARLI